ncbi:MAG: hypothetical protein IJX46_00805 [Clostridia bacterium]|nr:hypothetical protein [Clostridia bacterium]
MHAALRADAMHGFAVIYAALRRQAAVRGTPPPTPPREPRRGERETEVFGEPRRRGERLRPSANRGGEKERLRFSVSRGGEERLRPLSKFMGRKIEVFDEPRMGGERSRFSMSQGFGVGKGTKFVLTNSDSCDILLLAVDVLGFPDCSAFLFGEGFIGFCLSVDNFIAICYTVCRAIAQGIHDIRHCDLFSGKKSEGSFCFCVGVWVWIRLLYAELRFCNFACIYVDLML